MGRAKVSALRSPYYSNLIGGATFTVGAEGSNIINVAVQLKDTAVNNLAQRGKLNAWLSEDAVGDILLRPFLAPNGGYAIGTNGTLFPRAVGDSVLTKGTIVIDAVPEKFKTTTTMLYKVGGAQYSKAAATAILFSASHVVNSSKFGVILLQINAAGTVSTKVPLSPQVYTTAALALAAIPSADAGNVAIGYIQIAAKAAIWTANTDDLTNGSDLTTAAFVDATEAGLAPSEFGIVSEANGTIDINFTETGIRNPFYLNVEFPDGSIATSGQILFA